MYYHFNWSYLDMVRSRPKQWVNLPVGYNNNIKEVPTMFKKVVLKYNNRVPKDRTCLFDSLSSAISYVCQHKFGGKQFYQVASELNNARNKHVDNPLDIQIENIIVIIKKFDNLFNIHNITYLIGNQKKNQKKNAKKNKNVMNMIL